MKYLNTSFSYNMLFVSQKLLKFVDSALYKINEQFT